MDYFDKVIGNHKCPDCGRRSPLVNPVKNCVCQWKGVDHEKLQQSVEKIKKYMREHPPEGYQVAE